MTDESSLKALSQALKLEQEGRAFYLQAAEETLDEKGKRTFLSLAADEERHAEMVQRQLHEIGGGGSYALLPDIDATDIDLDGKLFPPERAQVEARIGRNPNELEALHVALENEIRSYDLYRAAAKETESAAGQQMYRWLASAEMTHFNLLMSNWESIVTTGHWL